MPRDEDRLLDMANAARDACDAVAGIDLDAFRGSRLVQAATERGLMIIGEAARHVSPDFQEAHPEIDWRAITGLRNLLVHEYRRISLERLHDIASRDVPRFLDVLGPLLPPAP